MGSCFDCRHNAYADISADFVHCCHPVTRAKTPKPVPGDPEAVNWMTSDIPAAEAFCDCSAHEPHPTTDEDTPEARDHE